MSTAPIFVAAGTAVGGTAALGTVGLPAGVILGDIIVVAVETANQSVAISSPGGYSEMPDSPQGTGAAGATNATRLTLFWKRYAEGDGAVSISDSGDHQLAQTFAFRGCPPTGDPWDVTAGGTDSNEDTSVSVGGDTTTEDNCLVAVFCARSADAGVDQFSSWANANLNDFTERSDAGTTQGNGGGHSLATGVKATAGAIGTSTATLATASTKAFIVVALKPSPYPWVKLLGAGTASGGNVTPVWPAHVSGDVGLLFVETAAQTVAAPDGWTEVTNSPQSTGTAGNAAATALQVFWRRAASSSETNPTVADGGDHQTVRIVTFANCVSTGNPWDVTSGSVKSSASTDVSVDGPTTTVNNCLAVIVVATGWDGNSTTEFSGWTNANLTALTTLLSYVVTTGNGGGFGVATGLKATAGAIGTTTATQANSFVNGQMVIALKTAAAAAVGRSWGYILG